MRILVAALALMLFGLANPFTAFAKDPFAIVPGVGLPDLSIGTPESEVLALLGSPTESVAYEQERQDFLDFGINPEGFIPFTIGYTHALVYLDGISSHPVFKVYIKDGKAAYIIFSKYNYDQALVDRYRVEKTLGFNMGIDAMTSALGPEDLCFNDNVHLVCDYKGLGISILFDQGQISTIDIYPPFK